MFCPKCGKQTADDSRVCSNCGQLINNNPSMMPVRPAGQVVDTGGFLWGLLGFCVPLAGLILYLVWKNERPVTAKAAGIGALVYLGVAIVFSILYFFVMVVVFASL